jgi:inositol-phosphate transport system substrate-binding protein
MDSARNLPIVTTLLLITLILAACLPSANVTPCTAQEQGAFAQEATSVINAPTPNALTIWAPAPGELCWRAFMPLAASQMDTTLPAVKVKPPFNTSSAAHFDRFEQAVTKSAAPDIAYADEKRLFRWAEKGWITPLDQCRTRHPEFDDVYPQLWADYAWNGHIWVIPIEISLTLLYYNRQLLKELGWEDAQIASLSARIVQGEFTLADMLDIAERAVQAGVVESGFAFWPAPRKQWTLLTTYKSYGGRLVDANQDRLVINRTALTNAYAFQQTLFAKQLTLSPLAGADYSSGLDQTIMGDAAVHGRVLFWQDNNSEWSSWANDVARDRGGEAYLFEQIGYALYPSGRRGEPGNVVQQSGFYVITSESVSGHRQQEIACRLLAKTLTPALNARHATSSAYLGVLTVQSTHPAYQSSRFIRETTPMLPYAWRPPIQHPDYEKYLVILLTFLDQVETNQLTPAAAADQAIQTLQIELAEPIKVE